MCVVSVSGRNFLMMHTHPSTECRFKLPHAASTQYIHADEDSDGNQTEEDSDGTEEEEGEEDDD